MGHVLAIEIKGVDVDLLLPSTATKKSGEEKGERKTGKKYIDSEWFAADDVIKHHVDEESQAKEVLAPNDSGEDKDLS